jgi:polyisoprenoid-binding protein YceI
MTKLTRLAFPLMILALAGGVALPQSMTAASIIPVPETVLQIDPAQTKVEFTLADVLHTVHGTFRLERGTIRFNPASGKAAGELVVDAASGSSGSGARDRRMTKNILEAGRYPEIVFRPDRLEGTVAAQGPSQVRLHGVFSIHGGGHELTVPLDVQADGGQYTATAHFVVPYQSWGMKNPSTLFLRVSDKVDITVHTVAKPAR